VLLLPFLVALIGYIVVTTAYLAGLVVILTTFVAGLAAGAIVLGIVGGLMYGMAAAVVVLSERLFTTGQILNDPLLGLKNNLSTMADVWGAKALPMATQIIAWLDKLIPKVEEAGLSMLDWFGKRLPEFLAISSKAVDILFEGLGRLAKAFGPLIDAMIANAPAWLTLFDTIITKVVIPALIQLVLWLSQAAIWLQVHLPSILPVATGLFQSLGQGVLGLATNLANLEQWFQQRMPAMKPIAESALGGIGTAIQAVGTAAGKVVDWFVANWPEISRIANEAWAAIRDGWNLLAPILGPIAQQVFRDLIQLEKDLNTHSGELKDAFRAVGLILIFMVESVLVTIDVVTHLVEWFLAALGAVAWFIQAVIDLIKHFRDLPAPMQIGIDVAKKVAEVLDAIAAAADRASKALGGISGVAQSLGGLTGVLQALHVPGFEAGGVVPGPKGSPMLAVVHGGETVIPTAGQSASTMSAVGMDLGFTNDLLNAIHTRLVSIDESLARPQVFSTAAYGRA
jgi:phage-related protein